MINDFIEVVTLTFEKSCGEKHTTNLRKHNIAEVVFDVFSIFIYYNAYEYDLDIQYCKKGKELCLNQVLQDLGCSSDKIPKYKYMSNAEVMSNYLGEYVSLINKYFKELCSYKIEN